MDRRGAVEGQIPPTPSGLVRLSSMSTHEQGAVKGTNTDAYPLFLYMKHALLQRCRETYPVCNNRKGYRLFIGFCFGLVLFFCFRRLVRSSALPHYCCGPKLVHRGIHGVRVLAACRE